MSSPHLGQRLSAFIDGELGHSERDRVLSHLTHCAECRVAVEEERALKTRLLGLSQPHLPESLIERLRGLPAPGTGGRVGQQPALSQRLASPTRRPAATAQVRRPGRGPRPVGRSRLRRAAVSTGAIVAAALSTAFAVGGGDTSGNPVRPQVDRFTVEHASVSGTVPLVDPASLVGAGAP